MRHRAIAAMLLAGLVAGCTTPPVAPPVTPATPPAPLACLAKDAVAVAFTDIQAATIGKCVRTRGLAVRSLFYENGASFSRTQAPGGQSPVMALLWQAEEPAALKSHPQFVELVGRVMACTSQTHCALSAPLAVLVSTVRVIPTAMD